MKKFNYIFLFFFVLISLKHSSEYDSFYSKEIGQIRDKNINKINQLNKNISSYINKNNLFNKTKDILKNITFGNELFENEYNYMNINYDNENDESLKHRFIPETLFEYNSSISSYNFFSTKTISKDDAGNFISILLIIGLNNKTLIISDLLGNIYLSYNTEYEINDIITFQQNNINYFYVVTKNYTSINKFIFLYNIYFNNTNTNITKDKEKEKLYDIINVQTFTEDEKRENIENYTYQLIDFYEKNIKEKKVGIIEEKNIQFSLNKSEYIIYINPTNIKGTNYLIIITNKYSFYKLNSKNLEIIFSSKIDINNTSNFSQNLIPIFMNYYYILFNKNEKGFILTKFENTSSPLGKCDLFPENSTEKILNYYLEEKSRSLYIISSLNKLYLSIPMFIQTTDKIKKNSCKNILISELNKIASDKDNGNIKYNFDITLLNKKLMITKNGINYEIVDITRIGEVNNENKLSSKIFNLNYDNEGNNNFTTRIIKDNKKYLFLKQIKNNALILFILYEKSGKIYKSEGQTFNFKVPVILVAFIIILIWNYLKNKNEDYSGNNLKNEYNKYNKGKIKYE